MNRACRTLCASAMFLAGLVSAASAHAVLVASAPAANSAVAAGAKTVELRFNSRIDAARSRLTLVREDRSQSVLPIVPGATEDTLTTHATLAPGAYTLHWQVLATDGHITRGDIPFTVTDH